MIQDFLLLLTTIDLFALLVGIAIGLGIIALMRGTQVWRHRSSFGYSAYYADRFRRRMTRVAAGALFVGIFGVFAYVLIWDQSEESLFASFGEPEEVVAQPNDVVSGMTILIPRLAVESELTHAPIVGQEWDISRLRDEVAHLAGTVYPGESGNTVLAGHVTVPGAGWGPFRELDTLQPGDEIFIQNGDERAFTYVVAEKQVVDPTDIQVAYPTDDDRLTLITCSDWDEEADTYAKRIVVIAYKIPDTSEVSALSLPQQ